MTLKVLTPVKLIRQDGAVALVEYVDVATDGIRSVRRVTVPISHIVNEQCDASVLAAGIPFGEVWDLHVPAITPDAISVQLRRRGLWTKGDVLKRPEEARGAVYEAAKEIYAALIRYCKE